MISDLTYTSKNLYTSNQIKSKPIYLLLGLGAISLYTKSFYYLINILIFTKSIIKFMKLTKLMSI